MKNYMILALFTLATRSVHGIVNDEYNVSIGLCTWLEKLNSPKDCGEKGWDIVQDPCK